MSLHKVDQTISFDDTQRPGNCFSVWHAIGRALGMVAALPARAVGLAIAHRPQLIPILIHARLLLDWQHARKARP